MMRAMRVVNKRHVGAKVGSISDDPVPETPHLPNLCR